MAAASRASRFPLTLLALLALAPARAADETAEWLKPATTITLERTRCFGNCSAYTLTLRGDGRLTFVGTYGVARKGTVSDLLPPKTMRRIARAVAAADFFALRPSYESAEDGCTGVFTDAPSVYLTVETKDRKKTVHDYLGCEGAPKALRKLEEKIDDLAGTDRWLEK